MVYNLRSIGMSLMDNSGQSSCSLKPAKEGKKSLSGSSNTASASSLNIPSRNQSSASANKNAAFNSYSHQNTNQNHATDTYVSLMSTFEESRTSSLKYKRRKQTKQTATMELHETSVINLDSSLDLTIPENDSTNGRIALDTSNNSTPNASSSSVTSTSSETDKKIVCSVLNCAAEFSSLMHLENHIELFKHSPCNPCLLARNCKLSHIPICYMCPGCDLEFSTREECTQHINIKRHLPFYPPIAITAYMCSQCLHLFGSVEACWLHIEQSSHHGMSYPFADDYSTDNKMNGPVAVAEELVQDMISKCNKVVYTVQCLECGMLMETPAILKHHMRETRNQHIVAALTETSLVEVFASYLASYSCNSCHRLFTGELKELAKHQCARAVVGTIIENNTRSFAEFIKRCALTVIKSLELENMPGPSRNVRLSPVCDRRNKTSESARGAAAKVSSNDSGQRSGKCEGVDSNYCDSEGVTGHCVENAVASENTQCISNTPFTSLHHSKVQNSKRKNENEEKKINIGEDFILIDDTDEGSDETDVDFAPGSGAKRKRKTKTANKTKHESPKKVENTPVAGTSSTSPSGAEQKSDSNNVLGSPFFVMNYKPRSSRLCGNILTQGYVVQPGESRLSPVKALTGGNQQVQHEERASSPSRYRLRNRSCDQTAQSAEGKDSDAGFGNVAQRFLQNAQPTKDAGSKLGSDDSLPWKRDRSRSPLQSLDTVPSYQSNVLTSGHAGQPYLNPIVATRAYNGITGLFGQPQMAGPSHYQLENPCSTSRAELLFPSALPLPSLLPQSTAARQRVNPRVGYQASVQNNFVARPAQTATSSTSSYDRYENYSYESTFRRCPSPPCTGLSKSIHTKELIATEHLSRMKNIVFLDLDNWGSFFHKLPRCLPDGTFVWGFFGGKLVWHAPYRLEIFRQMKRKELFYLNERCGATKDAADFAIVLAVGKMDEKLPTNIAFTIMSGDTGFCEVERQMRDSERKVLVVNPHTAARFSNDMIYALVTSITDT
ncbi:uncharacterized protein LOC123559910 [Mercenaria mercenaria]|uniref:uncharacterized protein LOC123559910 n=1 Tax=Mercenaria mercenaria TaxID=6596 RepID=UPI00234F1AEC|nr:uncharacterized protein LOC123559910 [Mercenaria mercenaria]